MTRSISAVRVAFNSLLLLPLFLAADNSRAEEPVQVIRDLAYSDRAGASSYELERRKLDLYLPPSGTRFPTILWLHGGGLVEGDKADGFNPKLAKTLAEQGLAVAMANYRLSLKATYPAYIEDTAAAFAWVKKNIAAHGGDPGRIFVGGHSAGAYLALMVGLDPVYLEAHGFGLDAVCGLVPVSGQTMTHYTVRQERGLPKDLILADDAAPVHHVRKDAPPILLLYGDADLPARAEESIYLAAALKAAGHLQVQHIQIAGRDHGTVAEWIGTPGDPAGSLILEFVRNQRPTSESTGPDSTLAPGPALKGSRTEAPSARKPYGRLPAQPAVGDRLIASYLERQARTLNETCLAEIKTPADWTNRREGYRQELFDMLGLNPLPPKTDLKATVTGRIDHEEFTVENLHFQSRPGLYVTANLYLPKGASGPVPAILYLCGHAQVKTNGISYGSKVAYQHHPIWFARHGYACLIIDSVELGEIMGQHHGTYREKMWWWNSRGYSAAAAEAWNCIRALDYLETRPEVDATRIGATGRSGGGAYTWWVAALDDRIKAACPVAGITDLQNHVVDGAVEGHCDCMYMVNTYRWDYAQVAALVAPRPLLICNTDKDSIFPLDGVTRLHEEVRRIYELLNAGDKLGLLVTEGGHADTQDLQVPVFRWFDRWLKRESRLIQQPAVPLFSGQQLRVFQELPQDEVTSRCYEDFTTLATGESLLEPDALRAELLKKTFGGWPRGARPAVARSIRGGVEKTGVRGAVYEFESEPGLPLQLFEVRLGDGPVERIRLRLLDGGGWDEFVKGIGGSLFGDYLGVAAPGGDPAAGLSAGLQPGESWVFFAPRGLGPTALSTNEPYLTQVKRRFMLLGQTLPGMQVWDVRRGVQVVRSVPGLERATVLLEPAPAMREVAAFAALFEPGTVLGPSDVQPRGDKQAPDFLNWRRVLTPAQLFLSSTQAGNSTPAP